MPYYRKNGEEGTGITEEKMRVGKIRDWESEIKQEKMKLGFS